MVYFNTGLHIIIDDALTNTFNRLVNVIMEVDLFATTQDEFRFEIKQSLSRADNNSGA